MSKIPGMCGWQLAAIFYIFLCGVVESSIKERVKVTMLLKGQFSSDAPDTEYHCYVSDSDGASVESFRKINTRQPFNTQGVRGTKNQAPPDAIRVGGSNAQWKVDLIEENDDDFGVFGCRATQAGRIETEISGIFMRSDAEIIPKDELFTKTVSVGETGVSIDVEVIRPPPPRDDETVLFIRWLKDNFRNDALNGMNSWPITRPVVEDDAGVYECHHDRSRDFARQGLQLLIVRACQFGRWGPPECIDICDNCYNGGICDATTGRCVCAPGFMGPNCLTGCGGNKFGDQCEFRCNTGSTDDGCRGYLFCLMDPFGCRCNAGFQDLNCLRACDVGKFGAGCLQECHCQNQHSCDRFTGQCDSAGCQASWNGHNCQVPDVCPDGFYGINCEMKCLCENNSACNKSTGLCTIGGCTPGSTQNGGFNCEVCDEGFFGDSCSGECHCTPDACDIVTGECAGCCLHQWIDSPSCDEGISDVNVVKVNPGVESMVTCHSVETTDSITYQAYVINLSRSQGNFDDMGVTQIAESPPTCGSSYCNRSRSFVITSARPTDQFYCQLLNSSSHVLAWLNTSFTTFVLPALTDPPEVQNVTENSATIQWKPWDQQSDSGDPPIVGYVTYYREATEAAVWMSARNTSHNETLEFTYSSLRDDTVYEFSVAAAREGIYGLGRRSPPVTIRTLCSKPAASPSSVLVENTDMNSLNISWEVEGHVANCSTGITAFIIYFKINNSEPQILRIVNSSVTWTVFSEEDGLQLGHEYIFLVSLVTNQESDLSEESATASLVAEMEPSLNGRPSLWWISLVVIPVAIVICILTGWFCKKHKVKTEKPGTDAQYSNKAVDVTDEAGDDVDNYSALKNNTKSGTSEYKDINITSDISVTYKTSTDNVNVIEDANAEYEAVGFKNRELPKEPESSAGQTDDVGDDVNDYSDLKNNTKSVTSEFKDINITSDISVTCETSTENVTVTEDANAEYEAVGFKNRKLPKEPESSAGQTEEDEDHDDIKQYAGVYINKPKITNKKVTTPSPIRVSEFQDFMERDKRTVTEEIVEEFMILSAETSVPAVEQDMEASKKSYNEADLDFNSRIKLKVKKDMKEADSYNAHIIQAHQRKETFIAAQGPFNYSMTVDFWRMAWQKNVRVIVMLTDSLDSSTCYWPKDVAATTILDDMIVVCQKMTNHDTYCEIEMKIFKVDDDEKHLTVHLFRLKDWPRDGVPDDSSDLINFIHQVKKAANGNKTTPLLVHCSDGRGPTGTFIALYILMSTLKESYRIRVFDVVKKLRKDRMDMVQTRVQYLFIYETLQLAHLTPQNCQSTLEEIKEMDNLELEKKAEAEFNAIMKIQSLNKDLQRRDGKAPENAHKNRFPSIIPVDRYRPILKSEGTTYGSNDYINATVLASDDGTMILTQAPLISILEDFWRLVYDYKCGRIIMMNEMNKANKTIVKYWPDTGFVPFGSMNVECVHTQTEGCFTQRHFAVTHFKSEESISVEQFVYDESIGKDGVSDLKNFIFATQTDKNDTTLIHCQNGVSLSAVYVVVKAQVNCLDREGTCDVFYAVQRLKKKNPNMILTQEDYTLCLKLLRCYLNEKDYIEFN